MSEIDDSELDRALDHSTHELQRIKRQLEETATQADLEAARTIRLWSIGGLAVLLLGAELLSPAPLNLESTVRLLAMFAGASAGLHVLTWIILKVSLRLRHGG